MSKPDEASAELFSRIEILFEDTHLVVLSKPAGLLSQGEETGGPNLVDHLRERFGRHYVGLIHRLDRNTSGVMVVAKRSKAANRLSEQLREGRLTRAYLGWMVGELKAPVRWAHRLLKDPGKNIVRVVAEKSEGQQAALHVSPKKLLRTPLTLTLAEFKLETGRSHQIRVQCAHEKLPLLGDLKYGSKIPGFQEALRSHPIARPALHSFSLSFEHPMSKEPMAFEAKLPADMDFS